MTKTHQQITRDREDLEKEYSDQWKAEKARMDAKRDALQAECGAIGHIWADSNRYFGTRACVCCLLEKDGDPSLGNVEGT